MKQLAGFDGLRNHVIEIQARHLFMPNFGIDSHHLRVIERGDESQHGARRRQIDIAARLIRFCFERKLLRVALVDRVFAEKIQRLANPFQSLDQIGVGKLMRMAVADGRTVRPDLEVGICGEHGGDPASVEFCHRIGLDYVSCSPFRVPVARLAAAQAALTKAVDVGF